MQKILFISFLFVFPGWCFSCEGMKTGTNYAAIEYLATNATSTVALADFNFYKPDGSENENFAFGQDDTYYQAMSVRNKPRLNIILRPGGERTYGLDFKGHETYMIRIFPPCVSLETATLDPYYGRTCAMCGPEVDHLAYQVVGSNTILYIKDGKQKIKAIK